PPFAHDCFPFQEPPDRHRPRVHRPGGAVAALRKGSAAQSVFLNFSAQPAPPGPRSAERAPCPAAADGRPSPRAPVGPVSAFSGVLCCYGHEPALCLVSPPSGSP